MAQTHVDAPELLASWGFACFCGAPHAWRGGGPPTAGTATRQQQPPTNHPLLSRRTWNRFRRGLPPPVIWKPWWFKSLLLRRCSALTQPRTVSWRSPKLWRDRQNSMANSGKCWFKSINLHAMKGKKEKRLAKWRRERSCRWRVPWGVGQFYG